MNISEYFKKFSRQTGFPNWSNFLLALLVIAVFVTYWLGLLEEHKEKLNVLERQTELRSVQLAKTLAVQTQTLFSGLDFVAQNLIADYLSGDIKGFDLAVRTATATYPKGSILQIAVADREGKIVYSNLQNPPIKDTGTSIRDRAHFLVHENSVNSGLYISQPVMGRLSNLWTIQTTRAIRENGVFQGVVVISIAPSYLSGFFKEILDNPKDVIILIREDGTYLARSRDEESVVGKFASSEHQFVTFPPALAAGSYDMVASVDGVERHYAWRRVGNLPIVLTIGLDKQPIWAPIREEFTRSLMQSAVFSVLLVLALLVMGWLAFLQRQAKDQAVRSEELLRKLVMHVPGGLFQLQADADGEVRFPYATPSLYKLHQIIPKVAQNNAELLIQAIHPEDVKRVQLEMREAVIQLQTWQGRYRVHDGAGAVHWLLATARPERRPDGSVLWHGYVQDITQEQAVQQALRTSEEHLRLTMEAVHDGLWRWDLESDLVRWDGRCWEMLGYPAVASDLTHHAFLELLHPNDLARFEKRIAAHLDQGESYHCEYRLRTATGGWLWVEARGNVTETANSRPIQMLGTHTDISERVAQAQWRRALLDESAAAILLATADRKIAHANRRAHSMFGKGDASLIGQSFRVIHLNDTNYESFSQGYAELRAEGFVRREWRFQLVDGSARWCDVYGTLLDPQDRQGQVIWTIVDVEERYRAESALRIAQQRLTAIIERFPAGVMLQERLNGPIVAMNHALCDLLGLAEPVAVMPEDLDFQIRELLSTPRLVESDASELQEASRSDSVERRLPDGRFFEVHCIALGEGEHSIGLFWILRDISARKQRESTLAYLAATDELTQLPNRRSFMERLQLELNDIRAGQASAGVLLMLDIDFFKKVNDTRGHAAGDQVLQHLANLLRQSLRLRNGDMAGRIGGEEFTILLAATDMHGGMQLAERLRELIAQTPALSDQGPISFTVSLGLSVLEPGSTNIDEVLARADAALYYAKRHGRNQVSAWNADAADKEV